MHSQGIDLKTIRHSSYSNMKIFRSHFVQPLKTKSDWLPWLTE